MSQEELNAVTEEAASQEAPKEEAPEVEAPKEAEVEASASKEEASKEEAPKEEAKEAAPAKEASEDKGPPQHRSRNPDRRHADGVPAIIRRRRPFGRRKVCRFCVDPTLQIDYRDPQLLKYFVTERGKIIPRRISGNCAKHQRQMARSIKRARVLGLMPFTVVTS